MSNDYLWDKSGPPEPDVEKLERMLEQFRHKGEPPRLEKPVVQMPKRPWMRREFLLAAAAVALLAVWYGTRGRGLHALPGSEGMMVARLAGAPIVGSKPIPGTGEMAVGQYLETDANSRARIDVGLIGEVEVQPNSRVGLLRTRPTEHRLALDRGKMRARIWAPPGLFFVETPSALATDLGCIYTLQVDEHGAGELRVERGWVAYEYKGRESFVPEGTMALTRPGIGPGTPFRIDASEALKSSLKKIDFELSGIAGGVQGGISGGVAGGVSGGVNGGVAGGVKGGVEGGVEGGVAGLRQQRAEAMQTVLKEAGKEDVVTLWHLLVREKGAERDHIYDRLAELNPPPAGVTREGVLSGDQDMLDAWWKGIQGKPSTWWRMWKMGWPPRIR